MNRLFGTDGIRGVAGQWPLTSEFVRRIGYGAGRVLTRGHGRRTLLVVRDTRESGPGLKASLAAGLAAAGFRVVDGGVLSTPAVAVLVPRRRFGAGVVISASHNPAEFNGIKFFGPAGTKLPDSLEQAIEKEIDAAEHAHLAAPSPRGRSVSDGSVAGGYLEFLRSTWPKRLDLKGFRLVLDCANGATSATAGALFRSLGADVTAISARPDGRNINRDCGALHPGRLAQAVKRRRAHLGVAFDGDGDRAIFVDEAGTVRDGDSVLTATARAWKAAGRLKKNTVVVTIMTNLGLFRALEALDIRTVETPVGDKYVWQALEKTGAVLGGEPSGHVIFRDFLPTGDGMLTALQVLRVMREADRPFSALTSLFVRYPQLLVNLAVREKPALESVKPVAREIEAVRARLGKTGRIIVRYSGTEPLLRIMVEGPDAGTVRAEADAVAKAVRGAGL